MRKGNMSTCQTMNLFVFTPQEKVREALWREGLCKLRYIKEEKTIKPHNLTRQELGIIARKIIKVLT